MGFVTVNKIQKFLLSHQLSKTMNLGLDLYISRCITKWINILTAFLAFFSEQFTYRELRILTTNRIFIKYCPNKSTDLQTRGLLEK